MGKLFDLINKDTKHKNESKRMTVIIRQLIITFMGLSVFHLIIDAFFVKSFKGVILWMVMLAVDALTMYVSYQASKSVILALFTLQKVLWIMVAVLLFGWEGGFQFFLILLVIVYSFGEAGYNRKKLLFSFIIGFCIFNYIMKFFITYIRIIILIFCFPFLSSVFYNFRKPSRNFPY